MDKKININLNNVYIFVVTTLFVFLGNLTTFFSYGINHIIKDAYLIIFVLIILLKPYIKFSYTKNRFNIAWTILLVTVLISKLINRDYDVLNTIILLTFVPFLFRLKEEYLIIMAYASFFAFVPFFYKYGLEVFNSYAIITATISLNILLLYGFSKKKVIYSIGIILATFVLLIYLQSRTALIAYFLCALLVLFTLVKKQKTSKKVLLIFLVPIVIIVFLNLYFETIYSLLFNKWSMYDVDITTGRAPIWINLLKNDLSFWGKGKNYFWNTYSQMDAHNIFFQLLGKYGVIPFIFFINMLIELYKLIQNSKADISKYTMIFMLHYLLIGTFENNLFLDIKSFTISFLFIIYIGLAHSNDARISEVIHNDK